MKVNYKKEQEVSSKEIITTFNPRNINYSLNAKCVQYMSPRNYRIHDLCPPPGHEGEIFLRIKSQNAKIHAIFHS
jgi:hypothetical protein